MWRPSGRTSRPSKNSVSSSKEGSITLSKVKYGSATSKVKEGSVTWAKVEEGSVTLKLEGVSVPAAPRASYDEAGGALAVASAVSGAPGVGDPLQEPSSRSCCPSVDKTSVSEPSKDPSKKMDRMAKKARAR